MAQEAMPKFQIGMSREPDSTGFGCVNQCPQIFSAFLWTQLSLSKSGKSRSEIAKEMNISYMTVKNWLQNESKIVQHIENSPDISTTKITKSRPAILEKLEKMLFVWIEDCNNNLKFPLSQALIQEKALRIFEKLKEESEENVTIEFLASRG